MSFGEPVLLLGLVLVPLGALAYAAMQARKRREAATFANPALMPNLVTARPGLRRHVPPLLLLIALAVLVVALARPQRTVASPERAATVMMVTDISGSMNATDVEPNRLAAAVKSAKRLTDELPETFRLGLVTFSDFAEQRAAPSTDRAAVRGALDRLTAVGGTAMGLGLERGLEAARQPVANADGTGTSRLPAVLVLLSDGKDTQGGIDADRGRAARARGRRPDLRDRPRDARRRGRGPGLLRHHDAHPGPAGHRDAQGDRAHQPRPLLRGRRLRQARGDLRGPRHAAVLQAGQGGGHGGLRRRRADAPPPWWRVVHGLVRPPHLSSA